MLVSFNIFLLCFISVDAPGDQMEEEEEEDDNEVLQAREVWA